MQVDKRTLVIGAVFVAAILVTSGLIYLELSKEKDDGIYIGDFKIWIEKESIDVPNTGFAPFPWDSSAQFYYNDVSGVAGTPIIPPLAHVVPYIDWTFKIHVKTPTTVTIERGDLMMFPGEDAGVFENIMFGMIYEFEFITIDGGEYKTFYAIFRTPAEGFDTLYYNSVAIPETEP